MKTLRLYLLVLLLALTLPGSADKIKVAVAGSPPFITSTGEQPDGLAIRIWEELAKRAELDYELVPTESVPKALEMVRNDQASVAIGPISITADRARSVAFTQPYFEASLGLLSRRGESGLWQRVKPFFSRAFILGTAFLFTLLAIVGTLVWAVERATNSAEFPPGAAGIGHGMWFAIVTMTTVGYGDKSPKTTAGRILTSVWMLVATLSFSTLTAGIATALALSSIDAATLDRPELMMGQRAAVIEGTTGATAAEAFQARLVTAPDLARAIELVSQGNADVVVFDYPALEYHLLKNPEPELVLSETRFSSQHYGFAVTQDSPLLFELDVALLKLRESGDLEEIEQVWLKDLHVSEK